MAPELPEGSCTEAEHQALRGDRRAFGMATTFIGIMDDGAGGFLLLANCKACQSTIALEVTAAEVA